MAKVSIKSEKSTPFEGIFQPELRVMNNSLTFSDIDVVLKNALYF